MKLSFSTLGCPGWSFEEILARGAAYGFDGVGFRGVAGELDLARVPEFSPDRLPATRARMAAAGLDAAMVLTSAKLIVPEGEVEANLALAEPGATPAWRMLPFFRGMERLAVTA